MSDTPLPEFVGDKIQFGVRSSDNGPTCLRITREIPGDTACFVLTGQKLRVKIDRTARTKVGIEFLGYALCIVSDQL